MKAITELLAQTVVKRKKNDPCLSVTVKHDSIVWMCHHCDWSGGVREGKVKGFINKYAKK